MGGAVGGGAAPTSTGLQGNNGGGGGFFAAGPATGGQIAQPAPTSFADTGGGAGAGLPMASPMDSAMAAFGQQQNQQQQVQQQQGFPTQQLGQLGTLTGNNMGDDNPLTNNTNPYGNGNGVRFNPASDEGMFGQGSFQQPQQQSSMLGLYGGLGGISPQIQQQKQQGFGFGGAYGQQAQSRMQSQYQPQQGMFQQQQPQLQGLQQLLSRMISGYQNRPQYGSQPSTSSPMPSYNTAASSYKPDYLRAQEALNRTATTKAEAQAAAEKAAQDKLNAEAGITDEDGGFAAWQRQQYNAYKNQNYGGG